MMYGYGFRPNNRLFVGGGGANPLWDGLQAYYTADNTPNDALGSYNGTLINGATYGTGIINNGFSFDGVNDYVDLGNNLDFDGTTPFSVSLWVNLTNNANLQSLFSKFRATQGYQIIRLSSGEVRFGLYAFDFAGSYLSVKTTNSLSPSVWVNVVVSYDGSRDVSGVNIYFNGVSQTLITESNALTQSISNNETVKIGTSDSLYFLNGVEDEIGVWNRELTPTEVTELYNSGAAKQYPTGILPLWNDLLAYYTADNTPNDALGNYNGTLVNGATYGTGIINNGFSFDGVDDYVDISSSISLKDGYSISLWINPNTLTGNLFDKYNSYALGLEYVCCFVGGKLYAWQFDNVNNSYRGRYVNLTSSFIATSSWSHIVVTYDGGDLSGSTKIYINSVQRDDVNFQTGAFVSMVDTNSILNFGKRSLANSNYFNGLQDEVAIWNRELTSTEVTELYNSGSGLQY